IIFEDYGKGFLSPELVRKICDQARDAGKIVTGDPNPDHPIKWKRVMAVTPNRNEAFLAAGLPSSDQVKPPIKDKPLLKSGKILLKKWQTRLLLITLGEHGMMLFERGKKPHHIPTKAREVFDVSGAGDTAIALFTLALCCDATAIEAAEIANHASAVVVGKVGTATVTREELVASSPRRRPAPGRVLEAGRDHRLDLSRSWFIGDKASDIECGRAAGVRTILVQTGYGAEEQHCGADWIARDLAHAAEIILEKTK